MKPLRDELIEAFPSVLEKELSSQYISEHSDLMWDVPKIPLIRAVPLYMLWCLDHSDDEDHLVFDNTIRALNTYAREKGNVSKKGLFKFDCSPTQMI